MTGFYMPIELENDCFQHKAIKFRKALVLGLVGWWGITNMISAYVLHITCEYFCFELIYALAYAPKES